LEREKPGNRVRLRDPVIAADRGAEGFEGEHLNIIGEKSYAR
jgi:hypothetical protein